MKNMTRNIIIIVLMFAAYYAYAGGTSDNNSKTEAQVHALTFAEASFLAVAASDDLRYSRAAQAVMEGAWRWGIRAYFPRLNISISENDRLQQIGADSFMKNYGVSIEQLI